MAERLDAEAKNEGDQESPDSVIDEEDGIQTRPNRKRKTKNRSISSPSCRPTCSIVVSFVNGRSTNARSKPDTPFSPLFHPRSSRTHGFPGMMTLTLRVKISRLWGPSLNPTLPPWSRSWKKKTQNWVPSVRSNPRSDCANWSPTYAIRIGIASGPSIGVRPTRSSRVVPVLTEQDRD